MSLPAPRRVPASPAAADTAGVDSVEAVRRLLEARGDVRLAYVFGSGAAGRSIDLLDLGKAPPVLAHQVIRRGRCIVSRDPAERADFEARTVLRYLDTAHLRRIQHRYLRVRAGAS